MRCVLAAAILALGIFVPIPTAAQEPDVECVIARATGETPTPTSAQADYRARLHALSTGHRVRVAVIDTGISRHEQIPRLEAGADFVAPETPDPFFDCDAHGTITAGVIAARHTGIAPGATLISIRQSSAHYRNYGGSTDDRAAGSLDTLARAIHNAIDERARVINISVVSCLPPDQAVRVDARGLDAALARAERAGAVVVASSGNAGNGCSPGHVVFPAHSPTVLAVAALESSHILAEYSLPVPASTGQTPLSAPGAVPLGLSTQGRGWADSAGGAPFVGTSFAAPVVAGTAALLAQRYPSASAAQLREHITQAAQPSLGVVDPLAVLTHVEGEYARPARGHSIALPAEENPAAVSRTQMLGAGLGLAVVLAAIIRAALRPARR